METNLRNALNKIQASDDLKIRTAKYLNAEINRRSYPKIRPRLRFSSVYSVCLSIIVILVISYNLYFSPVAYIDMDVNPSIGLTLNRFNRVISTHAYNEEGKVILNTADVRFKTYSEAAMILLDVIISNDYLSNLADNGLISMTVQAGDNKIESDMLISLNQLVNASLSEHHTNAQTDIFSVTGDIRANAHQHHISPAKYLAILELQSVDPNATFENSVDNSVAEIKNRTQNCHNNNQPQNEDNASEQPSSNKHHRNRGSHHN